MSLLPQAYLDAVVSLEMEVHEGAETKYQTIGTGFIVGLDYGETGEKGEGLFRVFTVTNRHVLAGKDVVWVRLNTKGGAAKRYLLQLKGEEGKTWLYHPNVAVDVAVGMTAARMLREEGIEFIYFRPGDIAMLGQMSELGIAAGDEIFLLGFPMGMSGVERKYVIARGGIIARIDEEILKETYGFLIDSAVFPGNSGGPVIVKPTRDSLHGKKAVDRAYVIGVVKSYIPYREVAYSLATNPPTPRVEFMENSGLAYVVPMDFVKEAADELMRKAGPKAVPEEPKVIDVKEGDQKPEVKAE